MSVIISSLTAKGRIVVVDRAILRQIVDAGHRRCRVTCLTAAGDQQGDTHSHQDGRPQLRLRHPQEHFLVDSYLLDKEPRGPEKQRVKPEHRQRCDALTNPPQQSG